MGVNIGSLLQLWCGLAEQLKVTREEHMDIDGPNQSVRNVLMQNMCQHTSHVLLPDRDV